jgi:hypothetical protein
VKVEIGAGYNALDLAQWYFAMTCNSVVVPEYLRGRRAARGISTMTDAAGIDALLQSMLAELSLAAVTQDQVTVIFDNEAGVVAATRRGEPMIVFTPKTPARKVAEPVPEGKAPAPTAVGARLDAGIRKLSETHYEVDASVRDWLLANPMKGARGARIVPSIKDGKSNGFKLYAIRPSSIYARVGFMNGDTIHAVNGIAIFTPDRALEAYEKVKDANKLEVDLTRRGKPIKLVIDVK